jgi:hypothetical protein
MDNKSQSQQAMECRIDGGSDRCFCGGPMMEMDDGGASFFSKMGRSLRESLENGAGNQKKGARKVHS